MLNNLNLFNCVTIMNYFIKNNVIFFQDSRRNFVATEVSLRKKTPCLKNYLEFLSITREYIPFCGFNQSQRYTIKPIVPSRIILRNFSMTQLVFSGQIILLVSYTNSEVDKKCNA